MAKDEKGKASTVAKTEKLWTLLRSYILRGQWTMRFLRGKNQCGHYIKKHLQPHVAVQRIKPGMSMYKVQHILARSVSTENG